PAHTFMNTGSLISGRPSMWSWLWYGIGSDAENRPGFVVLTSTGKSGQQQPIAQRQWHSGFLPSRFQGVHFQSKGDAVHYIENPPGVTATDERDIIDAIEKLNKIRQDSTDDPEIATRISQNDIPVVAKEVDQAAAALIKDLKQRGMFDETLVLWGGEFGRTPMAQADGRDHHIKGFSVWMAGSGIKGGITYGSTDDLGYTAVN